MSNEIEHGVERGFNYPFTIVFNHIHEYGLKAPELSTYMAMCSFADNQTRELFPTQSTIAKRAGLGERKVSDCIKKLAEFGLIEVVKRNRTSNLYRITAPRTAPRAEQELHNMHTRTARHAEQELHDMQTNYTHSNYTQSIYTQPNYKEEERDKGTCNNRKNGTVTSGQSGTLSQGHIIDTLADDIKDEYKAFDLSFVEFMKLVETLLSPVGKGNFIYKPSGGQDVNNAARQMIKLFYIDSKYINQDELLSLISEWEKQARESEWKSYIFKLVDYAGIARTTSSNGTSGKTAIEEHNDFLVEQFAIGEKDMYLCPDDLLQRVEERKRQLSDG